MNLNIFVNIVKLTEKLKIDFFTISKIAMDIVENNFINLTLLLTYTTYVCLIYNVI